MRGKGREDKKAGLLHLSSLLIILPYLIKLLDKYSKYCIDVRVFIVPRDLSAEKRVRNPLVISY